MKKAARPSSYFKAFEMGQDRPPVVFYAFDLLQLNGKDLRNLPVEKRKAKLEELLSDPPGVAVFRPRRERALGPSAGIRT